MANYLFTTPNVLEGPTGRNRLFYFYKRTVGVSVVKQNNVYRINRYPLDSSAESYQEFYPGGSKHVVNDTIKADLIAAGIGITEANFTAV